MFCHLYRIVSFALTSHFLLIPSAVVCFQVTLKKQIVIKNKIFKIKYLRVAAGPVLLQTEG